MKIWKLRSHWLKALPLTYMIFESEPSPCGFWFFVSVFALLSPFTVLPGLQSLIFSLLEDSERGSSVLIISLKDFSQNFSNITLHFCQRKSVWEPMMGSSKEEVKLAQTQDGPECSKLFPAPWDWVCSHGVPFYEGQWIHTNQNWETKIQKLSQKRRPILECTGL